MIFYVFFLMIRRPPRSTRTDTLFPYTTLFRSFIDTGAATTELTGAQCSPTGIHWVSDAYALSYGTARSMVKAGDDTWFFLTVDYDGGYSVEGNDIAAIEATGGKVLGKVRHPLNTPDFSSRQEERRVGKEGVITCRSRWSP